MAEPTVIEPTIVNTPPPAPAPAPEVKLFPDTPGAVTPPVVPPVTPPATPPVATPPADPKDVKPPTESKPPEAPKAPATPPTEYELKLPEGSLLSAEDLAQTLKDAKAAGLTKEQAEAKLNLQNQTANQTADRVRAQQEKAFSEQKIAWKNAVSKDVEMGGDKYNETVALASRAFKATASLELQKIMDSTGLGSHPEYVRQMAKIGRMMAEDKLILGQVGAAPAPMAKEAVLYGKTTPGADGKRPT